MEGTTTTFQLTVNPGPLNVSGAGSAAAIVKVTNTQVTPNVPTVQLNAAQAADKLFAVQVTGDGFARGRWDSNGRFDWSPGNSAQDVNLYRLGPGTLRTDNNFSVGGAILGVAGTTATNIQPNGVAAPGTVGTLADTGHVHQYTSFLSQYMVPTGVTAETVPRTLVIAVPGSVSSTVLNMNAIGLPSGLVINTLAFTVGATPAAGITHGWYTICDANRIVRANTTDQGSSSLWGTANTTVPLALSIGYTTPTSGLYYVGVCQVGATTASFTGVTGLSGGLNSLPPILRGTVSTTVFSGPPSVGSTVNTITAFGAHFYATTA